MLEFTEQCTLGTCSLFVNYSTIPGVKTLDLPKPGFAVSVFSNSMNLSKSLRISAFDFV